MSTYVFPPCQTPFVPVKNSDAVFPVRRIFCVGRNYADHVAEMGGDAKSDPPVFFTKPADAIGAQPARVAYPPRTSNLHHEVELVVFIGLGGADISADLALDHVYAYGVGIDLTRRDLQAAAKKAGSPWDMAQGFDDSCPVSYAVPASDIGHPDEGAVRLWVNKEIKQVGNLNQQIWSVKEIISILSTYVRLEPGDIILTGTPDGVGPLKRGDEVKVEIEGIASFETRIG